jgi:hypothetical protein
MKRLSILLASLLYADTYDEGLAYLNKIRLDVGLNSFTTNYILDNSANGHSNFLIQNNTVGHYQDSSLPYFTGVTPSDRAQASGYQYNVSENISFGSNSYIDSVDGLMSAIYHRFGFLNFNIDEIGFAKIESDSYYYGSVYTYNMGNSLMNSICSSSSGDYDNQGSYYQPCVNKSIKVKPTSLFSLALTNPSWIIYPVENQSDFIPVFYDESPDPLPDLDVSGNPISINFNDQKVSTVLFDSFTLTDDSGNSVDVRVLKSDTDPNGRFSEFDYAIFPLKRLDWNKYYTAEFKAKVDGDDFVKSWMFKTKDIGYPTMLVSTNNQTLGANLNSEYAISISTDLIDKFNGYSYRGNCSLDFIDYNTIKVVVKSGSCSITLENSVSFTLDSSKEPELVSTSTTSTSTYYKMNLNKGWNLISTPVDKSISKSELGGTIWTFSNGNWNLPSSANPKEGFWVYLSDSKELEFNGNSYSTSIPNSPSWSLLGAGESIDMSSIVNKIYWTFDTDWVYKPTTINRGQGFWIRDSI